MRLVGYRLDQCLGDARLANSSLAREQHHLPLATPRLTPAFEQQAELLLAPDDRRHAASLPRGEAALEHALAEHRVGDDAGLDTLHALHPELAQDEQVAEQPPRRIGDDDCSRLGYALQAGGEIRGFAYYRLLLGGAFADQVPDDHEAGRDADAHPLIPYPGCLQLRDSPCNREAGTNRALGLVLVRFRPAEVCQHTITHELGDMPLETRDLAGDRILIGTDHLAHVLGIETRRQRRRADEIDEHHRQLPTFRIAAPRRSGARRWRRRTGQGGRVVQGRDRRQHTLAIAEWQPQLLEIDVAERPDDIEIDAVLAEYGFEPKQTRMVEPAHESRRRTHPVAPSGGSGILAGPVMTASIAAAVAASTDRSRPAWSRTRQRRTPAPCAAVHRRHRP